MSEQRQNLEYHSDLVKTVNFSHDGQLLASGSVDSTIKLWDPSSGALYHTLRGHSNSVNTVVFSPDSQLLVSASADHTIKLWDPSSANLHRTLKGHSKEVNSVIFSPNGWLLASGSRDQTVKLWNPRTGELYQTLQGHSGGDNSIDFSPDSQLLVSYAGDGTVQLLDPSTGGHHQIYQNEFRWAWSKTRDTCSALKGSVLALGHGNGRVSFISSILFTEPVRNPFSEQESPVDYFNTDKAANTEHTSIKQQNSTKHITSKVAPAKDSQAASWAQHTQPVRSQTPNAAFETEAHHVGNAKQQNTVATLSDPQRPSIA
ncbi:WD40-repeat-containing domain protein [Aspergillus granulosus]|uniref:WD40-repeat-containing domain protein n=1 Tax=Aspergillus granulosus TaxID=176169 RepID=A0ABR4HCL4_9EURO